jgi:hypothetical protein
MSTLGVYQGNRRAPACVERDTRAISLLRILLQSGDPARPVPEWLRAAIVRHFSGEGAAPPSVNQVARQFECLVLIQPLVAGQAQLEAELSLIHSESFDG